MFGLTNKFLKFIKNLIFDLYRFGIISSYSIILNTKIKLIIFLSYKIEITKIVILIIKILYILKYKYIRQFPLILIFYTVAIAFFENKTHYINFINYFRPLEIFLILQVAYLTITSPNQFRDNYINIP